MAQRVSVAMRRINPTTIALIAGAALLLLVAFLFLRGGNEDQDKLTTANETAAAAAQDPEKRCASKATYDLIKRELFRRAAQLRGSDQAAFNGLAGYAAVRMERPVLESEDKDKGQVNCSGFISLDLPPGVAVVGGRRTLSADVDYSLQRAADGSGEVLTLGNAEAIITPLATLARTSQTAQEPGNIVAPAQGPAAPLPTVNNPIPAPPPPVAAPTPQPVPEPAPRPRQTVALPSFNCSFARTRGEIAVCRNEDLAQLDRIMASHFNRAMSEAGPGERAMLTRTRTRFLSYRDGCGSDACIAGAYRDRIAEIRDIMSGQWSAPR
ncbi:MAG: hypothetical protein ABIQ32_06195 [Sphingomicrobium sp.]